MVDYSVNFPENRLEDLIYNIGDVKAESVCVPSGFVSELCKEHDNITACVGFPGSVMPEVKQFEASNALACGAKNLDICVNVNRFINEDYDVMNRDFEALCVYTKIHKIKVTAFVPNKINTNLAEILCQKCIECGVDFLGMHYGSDVDLYLSLLKDSDVKLCLHGLVLKSDAEELLSKGVGRVITSWAKVCV